MMHNSSGTPVDWQNLTSMVWSGKRETEGDCLFDKCQNTFLIENSEQYFYVANWDANKNQTVKFVLLENYGKRLLLSTMVLVINYILL